MQISFIHYREYEIINFCTDTEEVNKNALNLLKCQYMNGHCSSHHILIIAILGAV